MDTQAAIMFHESALFFFGSALIGAATALFFDQRRSRPMADELLSIDALIHAPVAADAAPDQTTTHDHIEIEETTKHTMKGIAPWQLNAILK